jgi:hypothetical protein
MSSAGVPVGVVRVACAKVAAWPGLARAARLAAERTLAESRVAREAAEARRARHCAAMGREASASLEARDGAMRLLDAAKLEPGVRLHLAALRRAASGLAAQRAPPGAGVRRELRLPVRFDPSASTRGALLLVEDDRVVQCALEQQLSRLGYDVVCADDAEEAIETWLRSPTGYVMTDLGLPGRGGASGPRA